MTTASLAQRQSRLKLAADIQQQLLERLGRELREPLNGILPLADLLAETVSDDQQQTWARTIQASGEQLLRQLGNLSELQLDLAQEAGEDSNFVLAELLDELLSEYGPRATAAGLKVFDEIDERVPEQVRGNRKHIARVLGILLDNAIRYTPAGAVQLNIGIRTQEGESRLDFEVQDSGPGLPKAVKNQLFQPINQKHSEIPATSRGLGLTLARQYAGLLGGELTHEGHPDEGSSFRLSIPLRSADSVPVSDEGIDVAVLNGQVQRTGLAVAVLAAAWHQDADQAMDALQQACQQDDEMALQSAAADLRIASQLIGACRVARLCRQLGSSTSANCRQLLVQLQVETEIARRCLAEQQATTNKQGNA